MNLLPTLPIARRVALVRLPAALRGSHLLALLLLGLMGVVGLAVSPEREISVFRFVLFALGLATYIGTVVWISTPRRMARALDVFLAIAFGVTVLALLGTQYETYRFTPFENITQLMPRFPVSFLKAIGGREGLNANEVAGVLATMLPVLIGMVLWRGPSRIRFVCALASLALMATYLLLSLSRTAWLALLPAVIALLWLRKWWWGLGSLVFTFVSGFAALKLLANDSVQMLLFSDLTMPQWFATPTRYVIWQHGLELLRASPLTGVGIGAFARIFQARVAAQPFYGSVDIANAHNIVLQAALDVGVPGLLAYLALLAGAGLSAVRSARVSRDTYSAGEAFGMAAGLFAFLLYGTLQVVTLTARAAPLVWFVIALAAASPALEGAFSEQ